MRRRRRRHGIDLFAGLGGASAAWLERDWIRKTLDNEGSFGCTYTRDILLVEDLEELEGGDGPFDFVWASPPCEALSVMTIGRNWRGDVLRWEAKTPKAELALQLATHTFDLIGAYRRRHPGCHYVVENPRGKLRAFFVPTTTTWYCRWGLPYAKPTDIWTSLRGRWPKCSPRNPDHAYAPRGSKLGVQTNDVEALRKMHKRRGVVESRAARDEHIQAEIARGRRLDFGDPLPDPPEDWSRTWMQDRELRAGSRQDIIERLRSGQRVPGYRLRKDGTLATQGTLAMTTDGTRAAIRALVPYALSLACAIAVDTNDGELVHDPALVREAAAV